MLLDALVYKLRFRSTSYGGHLGFLGHNDVITSN